jgi:hypothetical protein
MTKLHEDPTKALILDVATYITMATRKHIRMGVAGVVEVARGESPTIPTEPMVVGTEACHQEESEEDVGTVGGGTLYQLDRRFPL